ncbi:MAG: 4'-phosphopantetheinyl transferase superfamily protein [Bacteroidales bacterium]|nr:4'-phosphopantetheinyl transferase superfamily protein [Bacteroidales bacterium]
MIYLNDHIFDIDLSETLRKVGPQRAEYALRYRREQDKKLSVAVILLLMEGLEREYGLSGPPVFSFGPNGKPFLADHPEIHFNLSHCPRAALCALGDETVGCDIEAVPDELDWDVCRHCFNEAEQASIRDAANPLLAFTELWTRKEAYLKWTGEGLCDDLPGLFERTISLPRFLTRIAPDQSYVWTVCGNNLSQNCIPFIIR